MRHLVAERAVGGGPAAAEDGDTVRRMRVDDVREIHWNTAPSCRARCYSPVTGGCDRAAETTSETQQRDDAGDEDGRQQQAEGEGGGGAHAVTLPSYRCGRSVTGLVVPGPRSPSASGLSVT